MSKSRPTDSDERLTTAGESPMTEHRLDILINRIVDRVETPSEWNEFQSLAATDTSAWELLAEAQRDNERLTALALDATAIAERVSLPLHRGGVRADAGPLASGEWRQRRFWAGAGWATAAALLLAWVATGRAGVTSNGGEQTAGISLSAASPDDALRRYLDKGQKDGIVLGEVDQKILIDAQPLASGQFEVVFVRQIVERREVPAIIQFRSTDDSRSLQPHFMRATVRNPM